MKEFDYKDPQNYGGSINVSEETGSQECPEYQHLYMGILQCGEVNCVSLPPQEIIKFIKYLEYFCIEKGIK